MVETTPREEIVALHDFFVDWYRGRAGESDFETFEATLAPGFELVSPDGEVVDRPSVIEWIRESRGQYEAEPAGITIRAVEPVFERDDLVLVRYEEHQSGALGETVRLSTALLEGDADAPRGWVWHLVHETWLEE